MDFVTQIGGKYHTDNKPLFKLKEKLESIDVKVTHPLSKEFIDPKNAAAVYDPAVFSVYNVAVDYYESISTSDFHIVCNSYENNNGYIGENAAREILYAMLKNRPVVLLYEPKFKPGIDRLTKELIERHEHVIYVCNLLNLTNKALETYLKEITATPPKYKLDLREKTFIRARVRAYFRDSIPAIEVA